MIKQNNMELGKDLLDKIKIVKDALLKMGTIPATKVPAKLADVPVKDESGADVILTIDGDVPAVGMPVMVGTSPAADGEYILADGTTITIAAGLISEIATKESETTEVATEPNPMDALMSRLSVLEEAHKNTLATNTSLEAKLSEANKALELSFSAFEELLTKSVAINLEAQVSKKVALTDNSKMTNFEKLKFNRGETILR